MNEQDEDDAALFRAAVKDVAPLKSRGPRHAHRPTPSPRPLQREADERAVLQEMMEGPLHDVVGHLADSLDSRSLLLVPFSAVQMG